MPLMPPLHRPRGQRTRREYDAHRRSSTETRRLYGTARWQRQRAAQLTDEPFCRECAKVAVTAEATVCDHLEPHRGDVQKFWAGPFQSLCEPCHNSLKQRAEARG